MRTVSESPPASVYPAAGTLDDHLGFVAGPAVDLLGGRGGGEQAGGREGHDDSGEHGDTVGGGERGDAPRLMRNA